MKNGENGEPGMAVSAPLLPLMVNPKISPKSSDTYRNLPDGSARRFEIDVLFPGIKTKGKPGSKLRDPVALSILQAATRFDDGMPAYRNCPVECVVR